MLAASLTLIAFYLHFISGSLPAYFKPQHALSDDSLLDFSKWKKENVKDAFQISVLAQDRNWPKDPFWATEQNGRRRLAEATDRWKAEEAEMKQLFMQMKKERTQSSSTEKVTPSGVRNSKQKPDKNNRSNHQHLSTAKDIPYGATNPKQKLDESKRKNDQSISMKTSWNRQLQSSTLPPIQKTCKNPNDPVLGCPPSNLGQICNKYNGGDFESCFQTCKPSVCCTHDSKRQNARTCAETAVNCEFWLPCYIVWWKLSDTVGPATFLRLEQDDDFFNIDNQYIRDEINQIGGPNVVFYEQFFQRFVNDDVIDLDDLVFLDTTKWGQIHQ